VSFHPALRPLPYVSRSMHRWLLERPAIRWSNRREPAHGEAFLRTLVSFRSGSRPLVQTAGEETSPSRGGTR